MPLLGGLAIAFGTFLGLFYHNETMLFYLYLVGSDHYFDYRVLGRYIFNIKACYEVTWSIRSHSFLNFGWSYHRKITLPFLGIVELSPLLSIILTFLWMIGITNAINLIDGLDGLASGTSAIALLSIFIMAIMDGQLFVACLCIVLIGSNIGFLYHNFFLPVFIWEIQDRFFSVIQLG